MEFKAKNYNNQNTEEITSLSQIKLSSHNPRYTTLNSMDDDILEQIKNIADKAQDEIAMNLLSNEGDFSDLKNLLLSIRDVGFNSLGEQILLVKDNVKNHFVVAEGNRRTLSLKLIFNEIVLPNYEKIVSNADANDPLYQNSDENWDKNFLIRKKENYESIKKILEEIIAKNYNFTIEYIVVTDNNDLWRLIYNKHIAGVRPGMRQWSRGKYFTDILSFFKDGISSEGDISQKARILIQREPKVVIEDFKRAQFVRDVIKYSNKFGKKSEEVTNDDIFNLMKTIPVSALQYDFSLKRIIDAAKHILNIDRKEFTSKFFEMSFNEKNIIVYSDAKIIDPFNILEFIFDWYTREVITTRPVVTSMEVEFNLAVKKLLNKTDIDTKKPISVDELKKLDAFDYSIKELDNILRTGRANKIEEPILERYEVTKNIKVNTEQIEKFNGELFSTSDEPKDVFAKLRFQFLHNQNEKNYLNAAAGTIRSMVEQILIWGGYFIDDIVRTVVKTSDPITIQRNLYSNNLAKNKIHKMFDEIKRKHIQNLVDIEDSIKSICKNEKKSQANFIVTNESELNDVLNEFIHASHRIYSPSEYVGYLKKFEEWQKNILEIVSDIDYTKIKIVSDEIKAKI